DQENHVKGRANTSKSGIGKAVALAFSRYGVRQFALLDLNQDALDKTYQELKLENPDNQAILLPADTSDENAVQNAIEQTAERFKTINYGINSAGIGSQPIHTHEHSLQDWQKVINIDQTGIWICQKHLLQQMLKQEPRGDREGRGTIVNVSSMYGHIAAPAHIPLTPYTAAKHAVIGLTKADAKVYAPKGIRINAICPGYVDTPLIAGAVQLGVMKDEFEKTPAGRPATGEEVADSIAFLSSPMSSFIYGVGLTVDGGYSL
ncbi:short chain dehydrogenase/reductase family oxidoreductase, partial [Penicillium capsulatum]